LLTTNVTVTVRHLHSRFSNQLGIKGAEAGVNGLGQRLRHPVFDQFILLLRSVT
jgi:hypothetical protein